MADVPFSNQPIESLLPADAQARRDALTADPAFQERIKLRDATAFDEAAKLWRVAHGMPAEPVPPATPQDVRASMLDRDAEIDEARLTTWERHIRMDEVMQFEHRRGLATKDQHETALREIEKMKADRAFGAKVLAGDMDAKDRWMRWGRVASMQVAPDGFDWTHPTTEK
jgi:hypothetical protein